LKTEFKNHQSKGCSLWLLPFIAGQEKETDQFFIQTMKDKEGVFFKKD